MQVRLNSWPHTVEPPDHTFGPSPPEGATWRGFWPENAVSNPGWQKSLTRALPWLCQGGALRISKNTTANFVSFCVIFSFNYRQCQLALSGTLFSQNHLQLTPTYTERLPKAQLKQDNQRRGCWLHPFLRRSRSWNSGVLSPSWSPSSWCLPARATVGPLLEIWPVNLWFTSSLLHSSKPIRFNFTKPP